MAIRHGDELARKIRLTAPLLRLFTDRFWSHANLCELFRFFYRQSTGPSERRCR